MNTIKFTKNTFHLLKKNGFIVNSIEEMKLNEASLKTVVDFYENNGFVLTNEIKDFLSYYGKKTIVFKDISGSDTISLVPKKVFKQTNVLLWEETYNLGKIIPLGVFSKGLMTFFTTKENKTYLSFDTFLLFAGNSPFEGINNLFSHKNLKEINIEL